MTRLSTKAGWLEKAYLALCTLMVLYIPFHAFFSVSLGVVSQQPLLVKAAKELLLVLIVIIGVWIVVRRRKLARQFVRSRLNQLAVAFVGWHFVVALLLHSNLGATLASLAIDTRFVVFFLAVRLGMLLYNQTLRSYVLKAFVVSAVFVVGFGVLQQYALSSDILGYVGYGPDTIQPYLTVDKNPDFVRINSTLRGPNPLGAYVMICLTAVLSYLVSKREHLSKIVLSGGALAIVACLSVLYASYSRSAWIGTIIAIGALVIISIGRQLRAVVLGVVAAMLVLVGAGYLVVKDASFFQTVIIHEDPNNQARKSSSNEQHLASLTSALERTIHEPLGAGIGSTGSASYFGENKVVIENHYLFTAHEAGWLGLILLVLLQGSVLTVAYQHRRDWLAVSVCASGIGLIAIGLILPVFTDDTIAYLWWGLAAVGTYVIKKRDNYARTTQSTY